MQQKRVWVEAICESGDCLLCRDVRRSGPRSTSHLRGDSETCYMPHYSDRRFADGRLKNGSLDIRQPFEIEGTALIG